MDSGMYLPPLYGPGGTMMTSSNSWRLPLHTSAFPQGPHLTCYKLVLGLLVRDYAIVRQDGTMNAGWKDGDNDGNVDGEDDDETEDAHAPMEEGSAAARKNPISDNIPATVLAAKHLDVSNAPSSQGLMRPKQRRKMALLMLKLVQGPDLTLSGLVNELMRPEHCVSLAVLHRWRHHVLGVLQKRVGGLMELNHRIKKCVDQAYTGHITLVMKPSVLGVFIRRINVNFEALSFSDVSHLFHNLEQYIDNGRESLEFIDTLVQSYTRQRRPSSLDESRPPPPATIECDDLIHSRRQAEFYIAKQVELIQNSECHADSTEEIERMAGVILKSNEGLSQVYFLKYLNCLRNNEYSAALDNLVKAFNAESAPGAGGFIPGTGCLVNPEVTPPLKPEEANKGFRYAALNLVSLHSRFGHRASALSALREAISMAQSANDRVCLQHALGWLVRMQGTAGAAEEASVERERATAAESAPDLDLSYLRGLGYQTSARSFAMGAKNPSEVFDELTKSDMIACQTSDVELLSTSFSQKAAFWSMFGNANMCFAVSQLLLNLDTSDPKRDGHPFLTEHVAVALANLAKHVFLKGKSKAAESILDLGSSLFPNPSSPNGAIIRTARIETRFTRAIHLTNWIDAERCVDELLPLDTTETLFLRLQLALARGQAAAAEELLSQVEKALDRGGSGAPPVDRIRLLIHEVEWHCILRNYSHAITPVLEALRLAVQHNFGFLEAIIRLHLAHLHLHLDLFRDAVLTVTAVLPLLLSRGDRFEISRAYLLLAKCIVANAASGVAKPVPMSGAASERSLAFNGAVRHLKSALEGFKAINANQRVKDTLYMMARIYHEMNMVHDRNQVSAEFKAFDEQHPTNVTSKLAQML